MEQELKTSIDKLSRDLRIAAKSLTTDEARYLVDQYYVIQRNRIRARNQAKAMAKTNEPVALVNWLDEQMTTLEGQIKVSLDVYSQNHPIGEWMRSQVGIGPVIAAGLLSHIDIEKAPTVGHIYSFAGLSPHSVWNKGQRRPWNARLKTLCWKLGESFVKVSRNEKAFYGKLYLESRENLIERNKAGEFAEQCREILANKKIGKDTEAYLWYAGYLTSSDLATYYDLPAAKRLGYVKAVTKTLDQGTKMLPPAHVFARAKRWTVKIFLSHLHEVWFEQHFQRPAPEPYVITHLGHVHKIRRPNHKK